MGTPSIYHRVPHWDSMAPPAPGPLPAPGYTPAAARRPSVNVTISRPPSTARGRAVGLRPPISHGPRDRRSK